MYSTSIDCIMKRNYAGFLSAMETFDLALGKFFFWALTISVFGLSAFLVYSAAVTDKSWKHVVFLLIMAAIAAIVGICIYRRRKKDW